MKSLGYLLAAAVLLFPGQDIFAQSSSPASAEIEATVERFHRALAQGDQTAALELLAADALILENGQAQTRGEYEREHLGEDIAFARTTTTERSQLKIEQEGDAAWVGATSKTTGTFNGRKIDTVGVELLVLTKSDSGWRIRAIHWSTRKGK
jgi:ketosteroid isomerase-like protein